MAVHWQAADREGRDAEKGDVGGGCGDGGVERNGPFVVLRREAVRGEGYKLKVGDAVGGDDERVVGAAHDHVWRVICAVCGVCGQGRKLGGGGAIGVGGRNGDVAVVDVALGRAAGH